MKKATLVVSRHYLGNKIFNRSDATLNRDDNLAPFSFLKSALAEKGFELCTQDIHPIKSSELVIYNEMPRALPLSKDIYKSHLLILESPIIIKNNWISKKHQQFNKVFTWNDTLVDNKKYYKINYSFDFNCDANLVHPKNKLCILISAHKLSNQKQELYTERIRAIRWFEKNAPNDFDLFGFGWDKPAFKGLMKIIKKIPGYEKFVPFNPFPSYKGTITSKLAALKNYSFAICYENVQDVPGYITEKIFDCFFAGTVPVYLGASNITDHIPADCFIDKRNFSSYSELYQYLSKMSPERYSQYIQNISTYLKSEKAMTFHAKHFAATIATHSTGSEI